MTNEQAKDVTIIAIDGLDLIANSRDQALRGFGATIAGITWRRACEGETSRDGRWVVGGGQWRYGC